MSGQITAEKDGHVLCIGINRPEKRNAFTLAMLDQLSFAYERLAEDDELRVGVLYGHGDHFSSGLDLSELGPALAAHGPSVLAGSGRFDPCGLWRKSVPKPVVMAVNGVAFTLSIELALAADIVIAAEDVRFCHMEVSRGLLPLGGATFRAPFRVGWSNAMRFLLTADEFGAVEAQRIGLVQEIVPVGQHLDRALEIARRIAIQAPLGVQGTIANARIACCEREQAAIVHLKELLPKIVKSDDAAEGLLSFLERRVGRFVGH